MRVWSLSTEMTCVRVLKYTGIYVPQSQPGICLSNKKNILVWAMARLATSWAWTTSCSLACLLACCSCCACCMCQLHAESSCIHVYIYVLVYIYMYIYKYVCIVVMTINLFRGTACAEEPRKCICTYIYIHVNIYTCNLNIYTCSLIALYSILCRSSQVVSSILGVCRLSSFLHRRQCVSAE